ncbi:MAG: hypothetical protein M3Y28_05110 [Armatimonadota bacterium]|nr:hypothetical protein [Armatimonadota bacterium]
MEPTSAETAPLAEIWARTFDRVRREVDVPTVWLAIQSVTPLAIDGNFFVASLPSDQQFLRINLENAEASGAIEEALREVTGRILAFRLIRGQTLADWERERPPDATRPDAAYHGGITQTSPFEHRTSPPTRPAERPHPSREPSPSPSWDKLNERLSQGYKTAPYNKYPHGQARYLMQCIPILSDTMDVLMPPPGQPRDEHQERSLAKTLDRLGSIMGNLDPIFIALELLRFRQAEGIDISV